MLFLPIPVIKLSSFDDRLMICFATLIATRAGGPTNFKYSIFQFLVTTHLIDKRQLFAKIWSLFTLDSLSLYTIILVLLTACVCITLFLQVKLRTQKYKPSADSHTSTL